MLTRRHGLTGLLSLLGLVAAALLMGLSGAPSASAAVPDIVWRTNAHIPDVRSIAFSGDGLHLASGDDGNFAMVWALTNRTRVAVVQTPAKVISIALPPTASFFVTGGDDGAMRAWSLPEGALIWGWRPSDYIIWTLACSPDGMSVAVGLSHPTVRINRLSDGAGSIPFSEHQREVYSVAWSRNGAFLASASEDGTAKMWRVDDPALLYTAIGESYYPAGQQPDYGPKPVFSADFSPAGEVWVTAAADTTARLYRVEDGTQVRVLAGGGTADSNALGTAAKFSADGKALFTLDTAFQAGGTIKFWRVADGRLLETFERTAARCLAVSPDGKHFAYGTSTEVVLARVPLWIDQVEQVADQLILHWQGGSGRYQVQRASDALTGPWENVGGPTSATASTNTITGTVFYRVQSLPQP